MMYNMSLNINNNLLLISVLTMHCKHTHIHHILRIIM